MFIFDSVDFRHMRKCRPLLIFTCLLSLTVLAQHKSYPKIRFNEIDETKLDTFRIKAYVLDIYVCPPCPKGAQCKPCMENHLTVTDKKPKDLFDHASYRRLRILSQNPGNFKPQQTYWFTVGLRDKATPIVEVELVVQDPK